MKLVYFAWIREQIGVGSEERAAPVGVETAGDLIAWLAGQGETYAAAFAEPKMIRIAFDQELVEHDAAIGDTAEVAFFPPMTGG